MSAQTYRRLYWNTDIVPLQILNAILKDWLDRVASNNYLASVRITSEDRNRQFTIRIQGPLGEAKTIDDLLIHRFMERYHEWTVAWHIDNGIADKDICMPL